MVFPHLCQFSAGYLFIFCCIPTPWCNRTGSKLIYHTNERKHIYLTGQLFWYSPRCQGFDPWPKNSCRNMGFYLPKMKLESAGKKDWISNHWIEPPTMETTEINRQTEGFFYQCRNRGRHPHKGYTSSTKENQNRHFQCPAGKPHENRDQICCPVLLHQLAVLDRRMLCAEVGCQDRLWRWPSARICNGFYSYTPKPMVFGLKATPFGWYWDSPCGETSIFSSAIDCHKHPMLGTHFWLILLWLRQGKMNPKGSRGPPLFHMVHSLFHMVSLGLQQKKPATFQRMFHDPPGFRLRAHRNPQWFLWRLHFGFLMLSRVECSAGIWMLLFHGFS